MLWNFFPNISVIISCHLEEHFPWVSHFSIHFVNRNTKCHLLHSLFYKYYYITYLEYTDSVSIQNKERVCIQLRKAGQCLPNVRDLHTYCLIKDMGYLTSGYSLAGIHLGPTMSPCRIQEKGEMV